MRRYNINDLILLLQHKSMSIDDISESLDVSRRTVRRWLEEIEEQDLPIVRMGVYPTSPYRILKSKPGY